MDIFEKGRESLLQALAVMRDDEEYREKYGGITDIVSSRRENSIIVLCDAIHRMKKEADEKNKCAKLLEDVAGCWKVIQEDRQRMAQKIQEMEEENAQLKEKVAQLREILNAANNSRSSSIESWNPDSCRDEVVESIEEESSGDIQQVD